ncbi:phage major capsid protein [Streptomyces carpaticus]|uniref:phage major capsid protein n=1 Tax=Streptomyces carpaticus TaxID=285558 RepID=UPI0031F9F8A6
MNTHITRLKERRASLWDQAKALLDTAEGEKRDLSAEETKQWDALNADIDAIDKRATELHEAEQRRAAADAAFDALLGKPTDRTVPEPEGLAVQFRRLAAGEIRSVEVAPPPGAEARAQTKGTATAGGNTVPTSFYGRLVEHLVEVSGVMTAGPTVLNTSSGETLEIPITTDHGGAALVPEAGTIPEDDAAFGKRTLGAYKYGRLLKITRELLSDSGVDIEGYLARAAGRSLGLALGAHLITGTGTNQPLGIAPTATAGVTGAGATPTADELIDLFYSVIAPYRASSSCGWLLADTSIAAIRKLKDSQGQYLWQPSITVGAPDTILGKAVHSDPFVPAAAGGAKSVLFGDFTAYWVRMVGALRFERSDEHAFNQDMVTFRALLRADAMTVDQTGAIKAFVGGGE